MALSNNYEFTNDCCGYSLFKRQICEIRDSSVAFPNDGSASQIYKQQQDQFRGMLFRNVALSHCGCFYCPCCFKLSFEVNGFNTKLTEVKIPRAFGCCGECSENGICIMLSCCPEYDVINSSNMTYGKIKPFCLRGLTTCCGETTASNLSLNTNYRITRDCGGVSCCSINWTVKEMVTDSVVSNIRLSGCCGLCPSYSLFFINVMSNEDKLLLLSTIPFLP